MGGKSAGLIAEVFKDRRSDANSAALFVHELGHNLGMFHDFDKKHKGYGEGLPDSQHSGPCNDKGIMSYGTHPLEWSVCSKKDQVEMFKSETHRCMANNNNNNNNNNQGSRCKCSGKTVTSGWWAGIGSCGSARVPCGDFCFVNDGDCPDQFKLYGLREHGYASCTACPQSRNKPALKTATCGSSGFVGKGVGLLAAAGLLVALGF